MEMIKRTSIMISQPTTSEIRESNRKFNDVYQSLNGFEKSHFHQILNSLKINVIKIDHARWLKNKNKTKLYKDINLLRLFVKFILLFSLVAWPVMFFTIVGNNNANYIVVALIYFVLFAEVISYQNSISLLEIEIDKNDVEIVTLEQIIKKTAMHVEIRDLLDVFFKFCESDGNFKAQDIYMPSICFSIASMIKSKQYDIDSDVFF
jgi:hypothetical protein